MMPEILEIPICYPTVAEIKCIEIAVWRGLAERNEAATAA